MRPLVSTAVALALAVEVVLEGVIKVADVAVDTEIEMLEVELEIVLKAVLDESVFFTVDVDVEGFGHFFASATLAEASKPKQSN